MKQPKPYWYGLLPYCYTKCPNYSSKWNNLSDLVHYCDGKMQDDDWGEICAPIVEEMADRLGYGNEDGV